MAYLLSGELERITAVGAGLVGGRSGIESVDRVLQLLGERGEVRRFVRRFVALHAGLKHRDPPDDVAPLGARVVTAPGTTNRTGHQVRPMKRTLLVDVAVVVAMPMSVPSAAAAAMLDVAGST